MDTANYIMLSRQLGLFRQMDVIANNVANADTAGYKSESMLFREFVIQAANGRKAAFTQDAATARDLAQGPLRHTGRQLDVAIQGKGYFTVSTPLGPRYTRLGAFHAAPDGTLMTAQGYPVQGEGGAVALDENDTEIIIREDGTVSARTAGSPLLEDRGKLSVVSFENEQELKQAGSGLYLSDEAPAPVESGYRVAQGMLENSNVNPVRELTDMIEISRLVGSTASYLNDMHDLERRAVNVLSRQQ